MTAHSVLNVRAAPEWGNSELYRYYERNGLGYGTVQDVSTVNGEKDKVQGQVQTNVQSQQGTADTPLPFA